MKNYRFISALLVGALLAASPAHAFTPSKMYDPNASTACTEIMVGIKIANKLILMTKSNPQINPLATSSINTMISLAQGPLKMATAANPTLKALVPNLSVIQKYATTGKLTASVSTALKNVTSLCASYLKK